MRTPLTIPDGLADRWDAIAPMLGALGVAIFGLCVLFAVLGGDD